MGEFFCEKGCFPGRLRDAGGESSLECLAQPLWTGLSREPLSKTPPLLQGARTTPLPLPPDTNHFSPSLGGGALRCNANNPSNSLGFPEGRGGGGAWPGPPPKSGKFEIP